MHVYIYFSPMLGTRHVSLVDRVCTHNLTSKGPYTGILMVDQCLVPYSEAYVLVV